jgi:hypothetical protein
MQFKQFINQPSAILSFSADEINMLAICSHQHYDRACQEAGKDGGIIFRLAKEMSWEVMGRLDLSLEKRLTFNEVDLLAKVVEPISALDHPVSVKSALYHQLMIVLQMLNSEFTRINPAEISPAIQKEDNG